MAPESLADLVHDLGPHARAATSAEAAEAGDVVVVTIPLHNYQQVPTEEPRGKIVIGTMNYYPQRDGNIAELDDEATTSSALLAAHLPDSTVVKGLNNIFFQHLAALPRPTGADDRSALAIAGDQREAKEVVREMLPSSGQVPVVEPDGDHVTRVRNRWLELVGGHRSGMDPWLPRGVLRKADWFSGWGQCFVFRRSSPGSVPHCAGRDRTPQVLRWLVVRCGCELAHCCGPG